MRAIKYWRKRDKAGERTLKTQIHWLFDPSYYAGQLKDKGLPGFQPEGDLLNHFLTSGMGRTLNPHPLFDSSWYLEQNPDVAASGDLPFLHFLRHGLAEGRNPNPLFDSAWYLEQNLDVAESGELPFLHFLRYGLAEGRNPHPLFDSEWYLERNPDVAVNGDPSFLHFLRHGLNEGRNPHPLFDTQWYVEQNGLDPELPPIFAFLFYGEAAGWSPTPLFDPDWYRERYPDVFVSDTAPFRHFVQHGLKEDRSPIRLFDENWYRMRHGDAVIGSSAFEHFLRYGAYQDFDPHPLFDTVWYRERYRERLGGMPPFFHYLANGNLQPNKIFDPSYVAQRIDKLEAVAKRRLPNVIEPRICRTSSAPQIIFTSIARNYLPHALVLAESVKAADPSAYFVIVLCDEMLDLNADDLHCVDEIIPVAELLPGRFRSWAFQHEIVELCTAAKGPALEHLLRRPGCASVVYFDPDIWVQGSLPIIDDALRDHAVLVTPHLLQPESADSAIRTNEFDALRHGAFNLGFLAVRNDEEGRSFAEWWSARIKRYCFDEREQGLFVDQKWMDLAPGFFPQLGILRHPGCNVAPWNLSRRRLEGDTYNGFTVDGEPLVFFHFSGHLNGAGASMLHRFASGNPAAMLLHELYAQRLAVEIALAGKTPTWSYGTYDNGEPITAAERRMYRTRLDLQSIFPDPFSIGPDASFLHWYRRTAERSTSPTQRYVSLPSSGRTLLDAYLILRETDRLRPCALFDPAFYKLTHADVARAGFDPDEHFIKHGLSEGRRCCPEFDFGLYASQTGAKDPEKLFDELLRDGLDPNVRPVATFFPAWDGPVLDRWTRNLQNERPTILMVCHYGGGGTSKSLEDLIETLADRANFLLLAPNLDGTLSLQAMVPTGETLLFDAGGLTTQLVGVLGQIGVDRVHVHHAQGIDGDLPAFLTALDRPYDVTLHDTYFLTPYPFFTHGSDARTRRGLDRSMIDGIERTIGRPLPKGTSLADWRAKLLPVLRGAERLVAPSRFMADLYRAFDPDLEIAAIPHLEGGRPGLPLTIPPLVDGILTIAFAGTLVPHKGTAMLVECAFEARRRDLPFRFLIIGPGTTETRQAGITSTGPYLDEQLPQLLKRHGVHVMWYPLLAPESYNYVLTVGLWSGLALAASDVGCLPERLEGVAQARILSVESGRQSWLDLFQSIRRQILDETFRSKPVLPPEDFFYLDAYLEPALRAAARRWSAAKEPGRGSNIMQESDKNV